ncbi:MAG: SGNH/GDSL hydrolase family protein [Acidobacteria bacterium]|nr:SGNH/GDSL hydrolase family protein [Acidobacteriota bacterium]
MATGGPVEMVRSPYMIFFSVILLCALAGAQQREPNPAFAPIQDAPGLPRVLLIGDSISIGYTLTARGLLDGKANVHRIPANAQTTRHTLSSLDPWLGKGKWDVIHVNWGLHDLRIMDDGKRQVSLEDYERNLRELFTRLRMTGARLIFATTTPVPEGPVSPKRFPADVPRYNGVAVRVAKQHGAAINDLHEAILPKLADLQRPDNVHFTDEGSRFLAELVAASIERALP